MKKTKGNKTPEIWYRAFFMNIEEVLVIHETSEYIVIADGSGSKERKDSEFFIYRRTRAEVVSAVIEKCEKRIRDMEFQFMHERRLLAEFKEKENV